MPLKKDSQGGGTTAEGIKSSMYCSYCYEGGKFLQADWTAKQMQDFSKEKLKEKGFPKFIVGFFTRGIPRFER